MNATNRTGIEPALFTTGCWLVVALVLAGCGGQGGLRGTSKTPIDGSATAGSNGGAGNSEIGGSMVAGVSGQGGVSSSVGGAGASSTGGTDVATGGVMSQGGSAGHGQDGSVDSSDALCDEAPLWKTVIRGTVGVGNCYPTSLVGGVPLGEIVINSDGKVVDITGIPGATRQTWLDGLADQRWPCLAGQTIQYSCTIGA